MAILVSDTLYRIALDSERNFVYVSAKGKADLIRFLVQEFAGKHEVFGVKEVGRDGSLTTVPVITDETYHKLLAAYVPPAPMTEFGAFLRQLQQQGPYRWPNRYFAWEKPDNSIFLVGIVSGQTNHILLYEQNQTPDRASEYGSLFYCINPAARYIRNGNIEYDPVIELDSKVSDYKYLGFWDDPDRFMEDPYRYNEKTLACGRWELALSHIKAQQQQPSLSSQISSARQRIMSPAGERGGGSALSR